MPEQEQSAVETQPEFEAITSQEQLDRIIGERLARERSKYADYNELKLKAAKFDEAEEASKSELEKAVARADKAEQQLRQAELNQLRGEVAAAKGLTLAQSKWLQGETQAELEANADQLLGAFTPAKPAGAPTVPLAGHEPTSNIKLSERDVVKQLFSD